MAPGEARGETGPGEDAAGGVERPGARRGGRSKVSGSCGPAERLKPRDRRGRRVDSNSYGEEERLMVQHIKKNRVVIRDLIIFQVKLLLDGVADLLIAQVALLAVAADLLFPAERKGKRFYAVMARAERFDRWLSLYGTAEKADLEEDGLFGASQAGADTLLGRLETLVTGRWEVEPEETTEAA